MYRLFIMIEIIILANESAHQCSLASMPSISQIEGDNQLVIVLQPTRKQQRGANRKGICEAMMFAKWPALPFEISSRSVSAALTPSMSSKLYDARCRHQSRRHESVSAFLVDEVYIVQDV